MKIKSKKQLQKVADAVRLLHTDAKWMWISKLGQVHLADQEPIGDPVWGLIGVNDSTACMSGIDLKMPVVDTLVQLKGE